MVWEKKRILFKNLLINVVNQKMSTSNYKLYKRKGLVLLILLLSMQSFTEPNIMSINITYYTIIV